MKQTIDLDINGENRQLQIDCHRTLLQVLRDQLRLTGTKEGCDTGNCGACTVLADGKPILSCLTLAVEAQGKKIVTIEGMANHGQLHPIQQAFIDHGAIQCGYCTPGMILSARALLDRNPRPSLQDVKDGMYGNLCRCTGYTRIVQAIQAAAAKLAQDRGT
ncbi:MAG: (2Fe-2S)-binding protein [Chloroflexi bacterium]|nr:(2Fe-2S)-binding protein [Chloroflexota bacterium]